MGKFLWNRSTSGRTSTGGSISGRVGPVNEPEDGTTPSGIVISGISDEGIRQPTIKERTYVTKFGSATA